MPHLLKDINEGQYMRQYQLDKNFSIDALTINDVAIPELKPHEVLVKVSAVSLNFRDYHIVRGGYPNKLSFPFTPVSDGAGEVVEVGPLVTNLMPGNRVMTHFLPEWRSGQPTASMLSQTLGAPLTGLLSEYVALPATALALMPDYLSFSEAATLPIAALTAWQALVEVSKVNASHTIVVQGTGGVALFAVQFAKMHGARVIITSSSDEKLRYASELGADELINYKVTHDWVGEVLRMTDSKGADFALDVAGSTLNESVAAIKAGGHVNAIGLLQGHAPELNIVPLLQYKKSVLGITVGSYTMLHDMLAAMEQHTIRPVIGASFAFEDAKEAFHKIAQGDTFGKIVIALDEEIGRTVAP